MARTSKTMTISVPPEMEIQIQELMRQEGRTRSELFREALRCYVQDRQWRDLLRYGRQKAAEAGITSEAQVDELIHDQRISRGA